QRETVQGLARTLGSFKHLAGDLAFEEEFYRGIAKVTPEDIQSVAKTYLAPEKASVALMNPQHEAPLSISIRDVKDAYSKSRQTAQSAAVQTATTSQEPTMITLSNGVRVIMKVNAHAPLVSLRAAMLGGSRFEQEHNCGISGLTAALLTKGTERYSAERMAETLDKTASGMSGFSGRNSIGLQGTFLQRFLGQGLEMFCESLLCPQFPEEEFAREQRLALEDIRASEDQLTYQAFRLFYETLYKQHPYRLPVAGTLESIQGLDPKQLQDFYTRLCQPENMVISAVGDFEPEDLQQRLEETIGSLSQKSLDLPQLQPEAVPTEMRTATKQKERQQAHMLLGFLGTTMFDMDRYTFSVLNAILSGQGGRLFLELRDKLSLAYSVSAFSAELYEPGFFAAYIGTSPEKLETAQEAMLKELRTLQQQPVPQEELERTKRYLKGSYAISLQRNGSQASSFALSELYGLGYKHHLQYIENIENVTAEDIQRVANQYFLLDRYVLAVLKP
ncbi:MAG: insulinase family protein, partial [Myxococcota bacterium]